MRYKEEKYFDVFLFKFLKKKEHKDRYQMIFHRKIGAYIAESRKIFFFSLYIYIFLFFLSQISIFVQGFYIYDNESFSQVKLKFYRKPETDSLMSTLNSQRSKPIGFSISVFFFRVLKLFTTARWVGFTRFHPRS